MKSTRLRLPLPLGALLVAGVTPLAAQTRLAVDTAALRRAVHAQLSDARAAAFRVRDVAERERLLGAVLGAQLAAADLPGAATTARAVGHDASGALTRAACGFVEARRFDDAESFARGAPLPPLDRAWLVAHVASQRARHDRAGGDTVAALRRAAALARVVALPLPRADALISVSASQLLAGDSIGAATTVDAARAAADSIDDADLRGQRLAMLAPHYAATGRVGEGLRLARSLASFDDRREGIVGVASTRAGARDPAVRATVDALVRDSARFDDSGARTMFLYSLERALSARGDSSLARRLAEENEQAGRAAPPLSRADSAEARAWAKDYAGAVALVERIRDPRRLGLKARAYVRVALPEGFIPNRDSAKVFLVRGRAAALAEAGAGVRDELLGRIASEQFRIADEAGAIETLRHVADDGTVIAVASGMGTWTGSKAGYAEQRRLATRLPRSAVRAAVLAWLIERHVQGDITHKPVLDDLAADRARADSITVPSYRARALAAVAGGLLARRDTAAARSILRSLLDAADVSNVTDRWSRVAPPVQQLVAIGDTATVRRWATARRAPAERARALLAYGQALRWHLDEVTRRPMMISNGPDPCTDTF